jgi:DNA-binding transcriptional regulator GbsR (MarR family)
MESRPAVIEKEERKLSELEIEAIEMFINFLRLIGLSKSIGEIYGLLFVSTQPLSMEAMMNRLNISLGAASQGLKLLRSFGAVRVTYQPGDRRDYYVADLQLSNFVTVFIKDELQPRMERSLERIKRMERLMEDMGPDERKLTQEKIDRLKHWLEKGQTMLPWILRFLVR